MNQSKEHIFIDYLFHIFILQKKYLRIIFSVPVAKNVIKKWAETNLITQFVSVYCFKLHIYLFSIKIYLRESDVNNLQKSSKLPVYPSNKQQW